MICFFFQAEDGIRDYDVTGVQTCALPIYSRSTGLSRYAEMVTATGDIYIEAALDLPQMLVKLAAKVGQAVIVGGLKDYVPRNLDSIQSIQKSTAMCMAWEG